MLLPAPRRLADAAADPRHRLRHHPGAVRARHRQLAGRGEEPAEAGREPLVRPHPREHPALRQLDRVVDLAARRRAPVSAGAAGGALPLAPRGGEPGGDRAGPAAAPFFPEVRSAVDLHLVGAGGVEAEHLDEHVEVPAGPREALELLDGVREAVHLRAAREQRPEAREEVPGGARDGGGVAAGGLEDLLPAQRLGPEHVEPGGEGAVADGGAALGGVGDGADHGHELAQAAAALVDAGARGPPGLEERDELPQELRLHDLHPRARDQHSSRGVCSLLKDQTLFSLEKKWGGGAAKASSVRGGAFG
jgi:hypothetical protein